MEFIRGQMENMSAELIMQLEKLKKILHDETSRMIKLNDNCYAKWGGSNEDKG
jgi:hypothetical protein